MKTNEPIRETAPPSKTPETDAQPSNFRRNGEPLDCPREFARRLERERDAAQSALSRRQSDHAAKRAECEWLQAQLGQKLAEVERLRAALRRVAAHPCDTGGACAVCNTYYPGHKRGCVVGDALKGRLLDGAGEEGRES